MTCSLSDGVNIKHTRHFSPDIVIFHRYDMLYHKIDLHKNDNEWSIFFSVDLRILIDTQIHFDRRRWRLRSQRNNWRVKTLLDNGQVCWKVKISKKSTYIQNNCVHFIPRPPYIVNFRKCMTIACVSCSVRWSLALSLSNSQVRISPKIERKNAFIFSKTGYTITDLPWEWARASGEARVS